VILGLGLIVLGLILRIGTHEVGRRIRYIPVTQKLASGRVLVKPLNGVDYRIEITPEMHNAQVTGNFTAYGGANNTVAAVLMPQSEYANWINGHEADTYYSSGGQKNSDQFAVRLGPGIYTFGISNRLSKKATKFVYLEVELIYYKAETY
jgi:hypothetical protein